MSPATFQPWALALVLLMALVIIVLLVLVLRKSAKASEFSDAGEDEESPAAAEAKKPEDRTDQAVIGSAFARARGILRSLSDRNQYGTFHLLIGAEGSREPYFLTKLAGSGMQLPYDPVQDGLAFGNGCAFHFFTEGVVLDIAGEQVLGAAGVKSDGRGWQSILRHLRELRPKRPADGVILTVSCSELQGAMKVESQLAARADSLHRVLWDLQRELGFRLPVYVLVTGCDKLTGFTDMAAALPEAARGEMIGWSSPHDVRLPSSAAWLEGAFDDLHRDLRDAQMRLFAAGAPGGGVMLFPSELQTLRKPLRTFLNHLFKPSAYREGMVMRGFYFCGSFEDETVFAADLIEQKVFPETGLAIPTSGTKMARNRKVRVLQSATAAAALLFTFGLIWAWFDLRRENRILKPILQSALDAQVTKNVASPDAEVAAATKILDGMAKIDFHRYGSVFVPSSWSGSFDRKLRRAVAVTFSTVVLDAVAVRLEKKAAKAVNDATSHVDEEEQRGIGATVDAILAVDETPEFRKLQKFVAEMQQVELHGRMFNALSEEGKGELRSLGELVKFSFGHPLSENFFRSGELYEKGLRSANASRTFDPEAHKVAATDSAIILAEALYARLYDPERNPFAARLTRLEEALNGNGRSARAGAGEFRQLALTMRELEHDLAGPELQWAFSPGFDLGPSWSAVLEAMKSSEFFGPPAAEAIRKRGLSGWSDFGLVLAAQSPYTGPILASHNGRPEMRLSTDTLKLKSALESFVNQGFAESPAGQRSLVTMLEQDTRMKWNPHLLQQAVDVSLGYDRFREKGLKLFDAELQNAVDAAAQVQAGAEMQASIRAAQTIESSPRELTNAVLEHELRNGVDAFDASAKLVDQNIQNLRRFAAHEAEAELVAAMTAEAMRLLRMTDTLLERSPPYEIASDFGWPDSGGSPSPEAWGADNPAGLTLYLNSSRSRLQRLARTYAKRVLAWMAHAGTDDLPENAALAGKWQSILDDLDDYDAKKPGNVTAALEDYISGAMTKVTIRDCSAAMLPGPLHAERYLGGTLDQLSRRITELCRAEASHEAVLRYTEIAEEFNNRLADRYPFAREVPTATQLEASVEDIRRFYQLFDASDALIRSIPADTPYGRPLRDARPFLEAMGKVRKFFAVFLDPEKAKRTPEVWVETQFRTLRPHERAGSEIIDWSLAIGGETVTDRKNKKLAWTPGDRVRLSLKWAKDAPHVPVRPAKRSGMTIDDRTVTYEYTNQWALLRALADLRAAADDVARGVEPPPVTLALVVDTEPVPLPKPVPDERPMPRSTKVFIRLALLTADGAPLEVPYFPPKAPAIDKVMIGDVR